MTEVTRDKTATFSPSVGTLKEEYSWAWANDPSDLGYNASGRLSIMEDIRYMRWAGQSRDCLRHEDDIGERAFPYEGAPDFRVNLVDSAILTIVDLLYTAFWNARVKVAPAGLSKTSAMAAAELKQVIGWMLRGPLMGKLINDAEFAAQVMQTVGWVVLHPKWRTETWMRKIKVNRQDLQAMLAQPQIDPVLEQLPALIADPSQEDEAAGVLMRMVPTMTEAKAKKAVRDLRTTGEAELIVPDEPDQKPEIEVLVPWMDFILPPEATMDHRNLRLCWVRRFISEEEARSRAREEEWSSAFLTAVLNTKGVSTEQKLSEEHETDVNSQLMEILYAYSQGTDDDGVKAITCTVYSDHVEEEIGPACQYVMEDETHLPPFIFLTTEVTGKRPADARGLGDVFASHQREMKVQRDGIGIYTQLSVTPPLQCRGTQTSKVAPQFGPLSRFYNTSGEYSWFPPPPGNPEVSFKLAEMLRKECEDYAGVTRGDTPPQHAAQRQQRQVMRWLQGWGQALWTLAVLAYQNLNPQDIAEILGRAPILHARAVARHVLQLWFDVRATDPEWVESLIESVLKVLQTDAAGVVDRAKLVELILAYLDPTLAEQVTSDMAGAKQAMVKGVRDELTAMMAGHEPMLVENDPTAKAKLSFMQGLLKQNPDAQQVFANDPRKGELLQKFQQNLQHSADQQDNKVIGRLGVKPNEQN